MNVINNLELYRFKVGAFSRQCGLAIACDNDTDNNYSSGEYILGEAIRTPFKRTSWIPTDYLLEPRPLGALASYQRSKRTHTSPNTIAIQNTEPNEFSAPEN